MSYSYGSIFSLIDDILEDSQNLSSYQPKRFCSEVSSSSFPPSNVSILKDTKECVIEVALAGCTENHIDLSFDDGLLKLVVDKPRKDKGDETYYVQKGLRKVYHEEISWRIDLRYYDRDTVDVGFKNGLLTIKLYPREEVAPKKVSLFGKLSLEEKEEKKDN